MLAATPRILLPHNMDDLVRATATTIRAPTPAELSSNLAKVYSNKPTQGREVLLLTTVRAVHAQICSGQSVSSGRGPTLESLVMESTTALEFLRMTHSLALLRLEAMRSQLLDMQADAEKGVATIGAKRQTSPARDPELADEEAYLVSQRRSLRQGVENVGRVADNYGRKAGVLHEIEEVIGMCHRELERKG